MGIGGTPKASDRTARGAEPTLILPADPAPPFRLRLKAVSTSMPIWGPTRPKPPPHASFLLLLVSLGAPAGSSHPHQHPSTPSIPAALPASSSLEPTWSPVPRLLLRLSPRKSWGAPPATGSRAGGVRAAAAGPPARRSPWGRGARPRAQSQAGRWAPRAGWAEPGGLLARVLTGRGEMGHIHSGGREGTIWTQMGTWGP